jgi:hypothetical protein
LGCCVRTPRCVKEEDHLRNSAIMQERGRAKKGDWMVRTKRDIKSWKGGGEFPLPLSSEVLCILRVTFREQLLIESNSDSN